MVDFGVHEKSFTKMMAGVFKEQGKYALSRLDDQLKGKRLPSKQESLTSVILRAGKRHLKADSSRRTLPGMLRTKKCGMPI